MTTDYTDYAFDMLAREILDWIDEFNYRAYTYHFKEKKKKELLKEINDTAIDREEKDIAEFTVQAGPRQKDNPEYINEIKQQVREEIKYKADILQGLINDCI